MYGTRKLISERLTVSLLPSPGEKEYGLGDPIAKEVESRGENFSKPALAV